MNVRSFLVTVLALSSLAVAGCAPQGSEIAETDPYLWLEEIDGERALHWVREQNAHTAERLKAHPEFESFYSQALAALNSTSRIPHVQQRGDYLYNFWRDEEHPRGLYRRTTLAELRKDEPEWKTVLDIDVMSAADGEKWVYKGITCLPDEYRHCLVRLSPGGGDATVIREFDMDALAFVEGGFELPVAKSQASWLDKDTLFVGTDFGDGSMTDSGYARISKLWERGAPLADASSLYEGDVKSVSAGASRIHMDAGDIDLVREGITFWRANRFHLVGDELHKLALPETARIEDGFQGKLVISLKETWERGSRSLRPGTVIIASPEELYEGALEEGAGEIEVLVEPTDEAVVEDVNATDEAILVTMLENVTGKLYRYRPSADGWQRDAIAFPDNGALSVTTTDAKSGSFFAEYESFVTPPTLFHVSGPDWQPELIKAQDATFDGSGFEVSQHFATSADGTRIPYFEVRSVDAELDGTNPTHIFSYGGFRNSLTPSYSGSYEPLQGAYGKLWLERGGVFVLANIRGGGEFGPDWHAAALLKNRHRAFEDFEAVAEDLIERGVTSAGHLGIEGRSNGGLLVGAALTRRPDLWGAVVCGVPLSDMRRYHKLLAGASWMAEYGDPDDPEMWEYIKTYSPYHNLAPNTDYPATFFFTSTRDDRVHPGHARKMAARMIELGQEVWYYENLEGGHGGSSTNDQLAYRLALAYSHLWSQLR
ncbi:MAG: prolyl oligopeptidase family protein [Thermoanaerobaculia bacterium]